MIAAINPVLIILINVLVKSNFHTLAIKWFLPAVNYDEGYLIMNNVYIMYNQ